MTAVVNRLGFPVFVKPANLGSSVGISKAKTRRRAADGDHARRRVRPQDRRRGRRAAGARNRVRRARQRRAGGVGAGEIIPSREFYDYEAKYLDDGSQDGDSRAAHRRADRKRSDAGGRRVQSDRLCRHGACRLPARRRQRRVVPQRGEHDSRIHDHQHVFEDVGGERLSYPALIDRLIALALERHAEKQQLRTSM